MLSKTYIVDDVQTKTSDDGTIQYAFISKNSLNSIKRKINYNDRECKQRKCAKKN